MSQKLGLPHSLHTDAFARLESFRALKFSKFESFRALNVLFLVEIFIFKKKIIVKGF